MRSRAVLAVLLVALGNVAATMQRGYWAVGGEMFLVLLPFVPVFIGWLRED